MRAFIIIAFTGLCIPLAAQQHALYSNYIFNLYMVNPAYAGARDAMSVSMSTRHQWIGLEGAPRTQNFTVHSPLAMRSMSAGFIVQHDVIGARQATSAAATYAYRVKLSESKMLSFGLQAGLINYFIDPQKMDFALPNDPVMYTLTGSKLLVNFDFGAMYTSNNTYLGISAMNLNRARLAGTEFNDNRLQPTLNIIAGHMMPINEDITLKPSAIVRKGVMDPLQFDLNMGVRFYNTLWITTSYRHLFGAVFSAHYLIREKLHIGYAFDWAMNGLVARQSGTHEIFLGIDLNVYRHKALHPRFF